MSKKCYIVLFLLCNSWFLLQAQTPATTEAPEKACQCFNDKNFAGIPYQQVRDATAFKV